MTGRTLQVTLPVDVDAEIAAAVSAGEYATAEDVVTGAVEQWRANRRLDASFDVEELRHLWREGIESGAGGEMSIDEIRGEGRRRLAQI